MKNLIKKILWSGLFVLSTQFTFAQTYLTINPLSTPTDLAASGWLGFMNVYELPANGGSFIFGSGWSVPDLTATADANHEICIGPNSINDPSDFWYQCVGGATPPNCGGPGAPGNKNMVAALYQEVSDGSLAGQALEFTIEITSYTFTAAHQTCIYIRDFAPDMSSNVEAKVPITGPGVYTVTLTTDPDPTRPVQYGFETQGENVWATDSGAFGTVKAVGVFQCLPNNGTLMNNN